MSVLFAETKEKAGCHDFFHIAVAISDCVENLCALATADVSVEDGLWFALHFGPRVLFGEGDKPTRAFMRCELLRTITETEQRVVWLMQKPHIKLFIAMETADADQETQALAQMEHMLPCCVSDSDLRFYRRLAATSRHHRSRVKRATTLCVLKVEKDHAGNQRRERPKGAKPRGCRRQFGTYICCCAKNRWASSSKTNPQKLKSLARVSFPLF